VENDFCRFEHRFALENISTSPEPTPPTPLGRQKVNSEKLLPYKQRQGKQLNLTRFSPKNVCRFYFMR
jgi:hypothetical protein